MRPRLRIANPRRLGQIFLVVTALCCLMMPVEYRAGAMRPHPHTIFQAYIDVAAGTTHHHGQEGTSQPYVTRDAGAAPVVRHAGEPDVPVLSPMTSPAERAAAYIALLTGVAILMVLWIWYRPAFDIPHLRRGIHLRPESPPPRLAVG